MGGCEVVGKIKGGRSIRGGSWLYLLRGGVVFGLGGSILGSIFEGWDSLVVCKVFERFCWVIKRLFFFEM